ncbi:MAG: hypothetical protein QM739_07785 [Propionivibrio sp.]
MKPAVLNIVTGLTSAMLVCTPSAWASKDTDPLAGATLTVYDGEGVHKIDLGKPETTNIPENPTMTVFAGGGSHTVALTPAAPIETPTTTDTPSSGYFRLTSGYRNDETSFNIASDASGNATPNIISELTWEMPNAEIRFDAGWTHASGFTLRGHLAYARTVFDGRVQDSDYALDDRQAEFSRSYSDPEGSTARDLSLGVGWRVPLAAGHVLTPMIGLARYSGHYRMRDGEQVLSNYGFGVPLGDFAGLDSTYEPEWRSGWIGLESVSRPNSRLTVRAGLKHHWFSYEADADWNLRTTFAHPVSFRQTGHGTGWEADLGADWAFLPQHSLTFDLSGRSLRLEDGNNVFFYANGQSHAQQLNGVFNDSWALRLGYRFDY